MYILWVNILMYLIGWVLYVAAQAQNSVTSKSNGLPSGFDGIKGWLRMHLVNLATRAFFSGLAYGFLVHTIAAKIQGVGFPLTSTAIAGVAGYSANAMLYQFFGLFPGLRVEVSALAPPPNSQIVVPLPPLPPPEPKEAPKP
jgi:hypothetical protein